jgi:hypothetical protein
LIFKICFWEIILFDLPDVEVIICQVTFLKLTCLFLCRQKIRDDYFADFRSSGPVPHRSHQEHLAVGGGRLHLPPNQLLPSRQIYLFLLIVMKTFRINFYILQEKAIFSYFESLNCVKEK